jgi:hypothetical protein
MMKGNMFHSGGNADPWWPSGPELGVGGHLFNWEPEVRSKGLSQRQTVNATVWTGPYPLVLGPSSWGFGIGPWGGTAILYPRELPTHVPVIH